MNYKFFVLSSVVAVTMFASCNRDKGSDNPNYLAPFFTVENVGSNYASFPSQTDSISPVLDSVAGGHFVLSGGNHTFDIFTQSEITSVIVGVYGYFGYYTIPTANAEKINGGYRVTLDFVDTLSMPLFYLRFAVSNASGKFSATKLFRIVAVHAGLGELSVSCDWTTGADVDLLLQEPGGEQIYFDNMKSVCLGKLIKDVNPFCWGSDSVNIEEVLYDTTGVVPSGEFTVKMKMFSSCGTGIPAPCNIHIRYNNTYNTNTDFSLDTTVTLDTINYAAFKEVLRFTISDDSKK